MVTVKPKFQVTIPAKLRRGLDLREGDVMEATVLGDGILLRPKDVVDRGAAAAQVAATLDAIERTPEDARRSGGEIRDIALVGRVLDRHRGHRRGAQRPSRR